MRMSITWLNPLRGIAAFRCTQSSRRLFGLTTASGCEDKVADDSNSDIQGHEHADNDNGQVDDFQMSKEALGNMTHMSEDLRRDFESLISANPYRVSWYLSRKKVDELNTISSYKERMKLITLFGALENKQLTLRSLKKEQNQLKLASQPQPDNKTDEGDGSEAFGKIMLWVRRADQITYLYHNLVWASKFGQNIVIDCSFDHLCNSRMMQNLRDQLQMITLFNRELREPFNLWLCNVKPDSLIRTNNFMSQYKVHPNYILNMTEKSYLQLFPKRELVYLTPDSNNLLKHVDKSKTYIIGGFADFSGKYPRETLGKAKMEGVTHARISSPLVTSKIIHNATVLKTLELARTEYGGDAGAALVKVMPKMKLKSVEVNDKQKNFKRFGGSGRRR